MNHIKKEHYNLYLLKTKEFKVVNVAFVFQRKNTVEDELYRTLLKKILFLKTAKCDNLEKLAIAATQIYNPKAFIKAQTSSQYRTFSIIGEFINEKYTEKGMNKKNLEYIMDYFWHPLIINNGFDKETFNQCKKNYLEELKNAKNYPEEYSLDQCFRFLNLYDFKIPTNEELINMLEKIDEKKLYNYYKSMFTEDSLEIFIVGDVDENIISTIDNYIYGGFALPKIIKSKEYQVKEVKQITEKIDNPQSKLLLGYKMHDLTEFEEKYVSLLLAVILGGGTESLLHQEVRKKRSLCYYIYASTYNLFNIMIISAGIAPNKSSEVIEIIKQEIEKIKQGKITSKKLEEVKRLYKNILLESKDSQMEILNNLIGMITKGADDIETRFTMINKVTVNDITNLASKIKLDTIFLLEGTK